jgi:hypothetical protein
VAALRLPGQLRQGSSILATVPVLYARSERAARRFLEYFAASIRNSNTRRAYLRAVIDFATWCAARNIDDIVDIEP